MKGRNLCQEEHRWRNKDKDERENSTVPCQVILRKLHTCEDRVHRFVFMQLPVAQEKKNST